MTTARTPAPARRLNSAAARSTERRGCWFESKRAPATRTTSTRTSRARAVAGGGETPPPPRARGRDSTPIVPSRGARAEAARRPCGNLRGASPVRPGFQGPSAEHLGRAAPGPRPRATLPATPPSVRPPANRTRAPAAPRRSHSGVVHRSKRHLRRLRRRVRSLGRRPGVLRAEGIHVRPEAMPELPRFAAGTARVVGLRLRRPRHRRPARLRARRRPAGARVLRRHLLEVRQRRPGALPAAPGPARLLLRPLPP